MTVFFIVFNVLKREMVASTQMVICLLSHDRFQLVTCSIDNIEESYVILSCCMESKSKCKHDDALLFGVNEGRLTINYCIDYESERLLNEFCCDS